MAETVTTNLTMPKSLHGRIKKEAQERGIFLRRLMVTMLEEAADAHDKRKK